MLKRFTLLCLLSAGVFFMALAQPGPRDGSLKELPLFVDFELFDGINLPQVYPGWQEAKGYLQPQFAGGAWFSANILYGSRTATVNFDLIGLKDEWIISPQFMATETTKISFVAALSRFWDEPAQGNLNFNDSISILVSTNTTQFEFIHVVHSFKQANQPSWIPQRYEFDLSPFAGQLIHLAFYATNGQEANSIAAFHLDDIEIKNAVAADVTPLALLSPVKNTCFQEQTPVTVKIYNDGLEPVASVPVRVRVRGAVNTNLYGIYPGTLLPGESGTFTVGYLDTPPYGEYRFSVQTELADDTFPYNDVLSEVVLQFDQPLELPLPFMNFMGFFSNNLGQIYPGWYEARGKGRPLVAMNTDWQGASYDGARTANVFFAQLGTEDWMVGPKFTATENLVVELRAAAQYIQGGAMMGSDDKLAIMISPDCGENWEEVAVINRQSNLTPSLQPFTFSIPQFAGQDVILAFYATTGSVNDPQQYILHITDVSIKNLYALDAGITRVLAPGNSCGFTSNEELVVEIENFGTQTLSGFQVAFSLNGADPVVETVSQSVAYGQKLVYTFDATLDLTQQEENILSVWTLVSGDENPANDGIYDLALQLSSFDLATQGTYAMGFEPHEDFSDWLVEDGNNDGVTWSLNSDPVHAHSGSHSFSYFSNQTSTPSNDWLFSPCFYLQEGVTYFVSFHYKNRATNWPESLKLNIGQQQNSSAMTQLILDLGQISNSGYLKAQAEFTVTQSGEYYLGWHAYGPADQFGMHIDDITIYQIFENDLALVNVRAPRSKDPNCTLEEVEVMEVQVWNAGTEDFASISVDVYVDDLEPVSFTLTDGLVAGATAWFTLEGGFVLDPYQVYELRIVNTTAGDLNAANDEIHIEQFLHAQYAMGFEPDEDFSDWTVQSLAGVNQWQLVNDVNVAHTGTHSFGIRTDGVGGNTANDDWLFSECFVLEAGKCYEISFWYRSRFSTENLAVYMGTDNQPVAMTQNLISIPSFNSNAYLKATQQFTVEEDGIYYFGWHTMGGTSGRFFIYVDEIRVVEDLGAQPVADPVAEVLDLEVFFQANATNYSTLMWDFGDGNTSEEAQVYHVYESTGTYNVSLTLGSGCVESVYEFTLDLQCIMPADFAWVVDGNTVNFTATGDASAYFWNFGDGTTAYGAVITHTFSNLQPETFNVTMTAFYPCGAVDVDKAVDVEVTKFVLSLVTDGPEVVTVSGGGEYAAGQQVTVVATLESGVGAVFLGWFEDEELLSNELSYVFDMPARNLELIAKVAIQPFVEEFAALNIRMYPNPATEVVFLQSEEPITRMIITSLQGKIVYEQEQLPANARIAVGNLSAGLYLVHITKGTNTATGKLQIVR